MAKKHIILFITTIFFLGTLGTGLCLTSSSKVTPNCCPSKNPSPINSEDCLLHCAKQKLDIIKTKHYLEIDVKTQVFLDNESSHNLRSSLSSHGLARNNYLDQIVNKLNISQIYFLAIFNHAPPLAFN